MPDKNLDVWINFKTDMSGFFAAGRQTAGVLRGIGQAAQQVNTTLSATQRLLTGGLVAGLGAASLVLKKGIGEFAKIEKVGLSLETLLGNTKAANAALRDLAKFAADTPFELPELAQTTKQLLGFGIAIEEIIGKKGALLEVLGNVSAITDVPLDQVVRAYTSLRQGLVDRAQLGAIGVSTEQLAAKGVKFNSAGSLESDGKQAADKLVEIFNERFKDGMSKLSQTLGGLWSTLIDNINMMLREVGAPLVPTIKDLMRKAIDELNKLGDDPKFMAGLKQSAKELADFFKPLIDRGSGLITRFVEMMREDPQQLVNAVRTFINVLKLLTAAVLTVASAQVLMKLLTMLGSLAGLFFGGPVGFAVGAAATIGLIAGFTLFKRKLDDLVPSVGAVSREQGRLNDLFGETPQLASTAGTAVDGLATKTANLGSQASIAAAQYRDLWAAAQSTGADTSALGTLTDPGIKMSPFAQDQIKRQQLMAIGKSAYEKGMITPNWVRSGALSDADFVKLGQQYVWQTTPFVTNQPAASTAPGGAAPTGAPAAGGMTPEQQKALAKAAQAQRDVTADLLQEIVSGFSGNVEKGCVRAAVYGMQALGIPVPNYEFTGDLLGWLRGPGKNWYVEVSPGKINSPGIAFTTGKGPLGGPPHATTVVGKEGKLLLTIDQDKVIEKRGAGNYQTAFELRSSALPNLLSGFGGVPAGLSPERKEQMQSIAQRFRKSAELRQSELQTAQDMVKERRTRETLIKRYEELGGEYGKQKAESERLTRNQEDWNKWMETMALPELQRSRFISAIGHSVWDQIVAGAKEYQQLQEQKLAAERRLADINKSYDDQERALRLRAVLGGDAGTGEARQRVRALQEQLQGEKDERARRDIQYQLEQAQIGLYNSQRGMGEEGIAQDLLSLQGNRLLDQRGELYKQYGQATTDDQRRELEEQIGRVNDALLDMALRYQETAPEISKVAAAAVLASQQLMQLAGIIQQAVQKIGASIGGAAGKVAGMGGGGAFTQPTGGAADWGFGDSGGEYETVMVPNPNYDPG